MPAALELPGLAVTLDRLDHVCDPARFSAATPHAFVYHLTLHNRSDRRVTFLGRKWIVSHADDSRQIIEGDGIVGRQPSLAPGETWSYHSLHLSAGPAFAEGSFHGVDEHGQKVFVRIPPFAMVVPTHPPAE